MLTVAAGGSQLPRFGWGTVVTQAQLDLVPILGILVAGGLYVLGVRHLQARGHAWPLSRSLTFLVGGLGTIAVATVSGLAAYDEELFGAHMIQHMLLTMVAPVFLALGAPITLALRTLPPRGRSTLLAVLHSRFARVVTFPAIPWILFVATPFALYFSNWYVASLEHVWLHELLHVHFLVVGCLFFWPMVGIDPVPGRAAYPFRMLMLFATLPFHAFLGVAIMSVKDNGDGLIAPSWYLPLRGLQGAVFQQQVGGGALWASGDLVGLLFLAVTLTQWMKASEREARREDRRLDRLEAAGSAVQGP